MDSVLEGIKDIQSILDDAKESIEGGVHLRLCNATLAAYQRAEALSGVKDDRGSDDDDEEEDEEEESEAESERSRTEDDMGVNELSELWEWQFDFGRRNAVIELEFLIDEITASVEAKRVCAAVRVLNRALKGSKPDDPADAERILEWKEELVAERAIRVCAGILEKVDDRVFHNENHDEHWLYSILCCEIVQLFERLAEGDALYRTKMRRNGVLKGMKEYAKDHPNSEALQPFLVV